MPNVTSWAASPTSLTTRSPTATARRSHGAAGVPAGPDTARSGSSSSRRRRPRLKRSWWAAVALAVLTALFSWPEQTTSVVHLVPGADASALRRALVRAGAGGTVIVDDGPQKLDYPVTQNVDDLDFASPVTVRCQPGAVLSKIRLQHVGHVSFAGCRFRADSGTAIAVAAGSHHLVFEGTVVDARGATSAFATGAGEVNTDITLRHVDFSGSSGDIVGAYRVRRLVITDSQLHDPVISPTTTDHVDGIQVVDATDVVLARNRIWQSSVPSWGGPHQGIMVGGIGENTDITIDGNVIGPWMGTGIITSDRSSTKPGTGRINRYTITDNAIVCANGGIATFWTPPSTAPSKSGNSFVRCRVPAERS